MKGVYNKEALNRIASEERLDRIIVIVSPMVWVSILGAFFIILGLITWGLFGSLPTSFDTKGIYSNADGTSPLYSQGDGFVIQKYVSEGDMVKEGDLLLSLGTEDDIFQIQQLDTRIQYVENMTFESEMDIVTMDTQEMAEIKLNAKNATTDSVTTQANLELKKEKLAKAKALVEEKEAEMLKYKEEYYSTLSITDQKNQLAYQEANTDYDTRFNLYEEAKKTYINAKENYYLKRDEFDAKYAEFDPEEREEAEVQQYEAELADLESVRSQADDYKYFMEQAEEDVKVANETLEKVRKEYLEFLNDTSKTAADNVMANTEYTESLQEYNTAKSAYKALSDEVDDLELKSVMDEGNAEVRVEDYIAKFDNKKSAVLIDLNAQRDKLFNQASKGEVHATCGGEIYNILVVEGQSVSKGTKIGDVMIRNTNLDSVHCYVKLEDAKKISRGMGALIYPSTVNKQEYGHIDGRIAFVDDYVSTHEDMMVQLGNESVVKEFESQGPVVLIKVDLLKDETSKSGYKWSSKKGKEVRLTQGTILDATIVTEEKRPIDLLIPYIKEKLEFRDEKENGK